MATEKQGGAKLEKGDLERKIIMAIDLISIIKKTKLHFLRREKMKRILMVIIIVLCAAGISNASPIALSNTPLLATEYQNFFNLGFIGNPPVSQATFDFNSNGVDGVIYSGVEKSNDGSMYAYFYSIEVFSTSPNVVQGFSFNFGLKPLSFDFGIPQGNSFWGDGNGWNSAYSDSTNAPLGASYDPATGIVAWNYFGTAALNPGEKSAWMMVISNLPPGLTTFNVLDSGAEAITGQIKAPVPEPVSMLLFGTGLVAAGGYVRRRFKK